MSNEHVEYDRDVNPYPSFGKKYNGEKAIISLTSWKARINTVAKTLYSLIKQCPGFHIVLVLSEEEFPSRMNSLPDTLNLFAKNHLIEVLWVYKNYKSFKKVLFTMDKYRDVPVISADDDFVYRCNYAELLYNMYKKYDTMVSCNASYKLGKVWPHGFAVLYPPKSLIIPNFVSLVTLLVSNNFVHDDGLLGRLYYMNYPNKMAMSLKMKWSDIAYIHTKSCITNGLSATHTKQQYLNEEQYINNLLRDMEV